MHRRRPKRGPPFSFSGRPAGRRDPRGGRPPARYSTTQRARTRPAPWYRYDATRSDGGPQAGPFSFSGILLEGATTTGERKQNPRRANGAARNRIRARWRAIGAPCAICGRAIDYSLGMITDPRTGRRRPDPRSFVLDEIVPVSRGGDPFSFENTRPAHWICNARRGDGTRTTGPTTRALPQPWDI